MQWEYCLLGDTTDGELVYMLFSREQSPTRQVTSQDQWDDVITLLGLLGWEAFSANDNPNGVTTWRFKRVISENNQYIRL